MANIIWDDTLVTTLGGGQWSEAFEDRFFGGSAIWPAFAVGTNGDTGQYGTLTVSFQGTSIAFHGNTPAAIDSQNIMVSFDGGSSSQASYGDASPPSSLQWYQSPSLSDAQHTINITHMAGTSVDFMVISAGPNTPLGGERLIVDDGDDDMTYSGTWAVNGNHYTSQTNPTSGLPYKNAVHQSGTKGSTATFVFSGNDVGVYSVFDFSHIGWVTVTYTIDGNSQTVTHAVTTSTSQYQQGVLQQENTLLWQSDSSLALGNHQLTIEIVDSDGQTDYVLDYILYTPSFETLAAKPNLTPTQVSTTPASTTGLSSSQTAAAGGVSSVGKATSGVGTMVTTAGGGTTTGIVSAVSASTGWVTVISGTVQTVVPVGSPSASGKSSGSDSVSGTSGATKSTPVGAIAGGVVGGVLLIAILLLLLLCRKRLFKRSPPPDIPSSDTLGTAGLLSGSVEPFTDIVSNTSTSKSRMASPTPMANLSSSGSRSNPRSEANSITDPPMSEHKSGLGPTGFPAVLAPVRREYVQAQDSASGSSSVTPPAAPTGGVFRDRMQRLQDLVTELNREISLGGEQSVRVAELKGRIAELTRVEAETGDRVIREHDARSMVTVTIPPPYEPR